ncbi:hydroxyproline-rich glycoprotein family protein [Euphorbia peplus]|nr:hydroxyproline-rich glycoprotein family protein [Euphorbia peplus]
MINATLSAIDSGVNRVPQRAAQKRRWTSFLCFGFQGERNTIRNAAIVPECSASTWPPMSIPLPYRVPPSSPTSLLQSEPPSVMQSPAGGMSSASRPASMHSPSEPYSIFAIGPYAYDTQLVSPPTAFSTLTTAPSTSPCTPESVHFTTKFSIEWPFALHIRSPLYSPSSEVSEPRNASPFPDGDSTARFLGFHIPGNSGNGKYKDQVPSHNVSFDSWVGP